MRLEVARAQVMEQIRRLYPRAVGVIAVRGNQLPGLGVRHVVHQAEHQRSPLLVAGDDGQFFPGR